MNEKLRELIVAANKCRIISKELQIKTNSPRRNFLTEALGIILDDDLESTIEENNEIAYWLNVIIRIHDELVCMGMDPNKVESYWSPILKTN